jgi:hypothetical protein
MNPELGPVVAASPGSKLSYLSGCGNRIFCWLDSVIPSIRDMAGLTGKIQKGSLTFIWLPFYKM